MGRNTLTVQAIHFFSQLVYLDVTPAMNHGAGVNVGNMADYYLDNPAGKLYLQARFGGISREYDLWKEFLEEKARLYGEWRAVDILDDNGPEQTGFYSCTYLGPDGERVVAFRGSELLGNRNYRNDYENDLALAYQNTTPQQAKTETYWSRFGQAEYRNGLAVTGHSLGGNLAVYSAIKAPGRIRSQITSCTAFNAPGFNEDFIRSNSASIALLSGRLTLYQNEFDIVSSFLKNITDPEIVASRFNPSELESPTVRDIFYPHSNFMFQTDAQGAFMAAQNGKDCRFCTAAHTLTNSFLLLPRNIREEIARLVLAALYRTPSKNKAVQYTLEEVTKYISRSELFPQKEHVAGTSIAFAARLLAGEYDIPQLCQAAFTDDGDVGISFLARTLLILMEFLRPGSTHCQATLEAS